MCSVCMCVFVCLFARDMLGILLPVHVHAEVFGFMLTFARPRKVPVQLVGHISHGERARHALVRV